MTQMIESLSALTTIPKKHLDKLLNKVYLCVGDAIEEALIENKNISEIDIGIGTLVVKFDVDNIYYKFIPNQNMTNVIKSTIINKQNMLTRTIESNLVNRIVNVYKDIL